MTDMLEKITSFYLGSRDFNGIPITQLVDEGNQAADLADLESLILAGLVSAVFGDVHPNPHIRALPDHHRPEKQVELIKSGKWEYACAYPLRKHLETVVKEADYVGRPYALALALGEPQLVHRAFDLSTLEPYRNDPRYSYTSDDIYGSISVQNEYYDNGSLRKHDEIIMQSFGFAYDEQFNKYVAAFNWDLFKLSPEHQQMWKHKEVTLSTKLHPDYYLSQILGQWPEKISIYQAFIEELQVLNKMAAAMERPPLFRHDYSGEARRPVEFSSLLRPTAKEYGSFIHLLDKLLSDNINKDFFAGEVPSEEDVPRKDGKVVVQQIGTLRMLEQWVRQRFTPKDPAPMDQMFETFRKVRRLRQKPAHAVDENRFDQQFIHDQRELMVDAYSALRRLRLIFANHPKAKSVEVPEELFEGKIWPR